MEKERIRFKVDYLLLGERQFSRLAVLVPQVLKMLSFGLFVLAVPQLEMLYRSFPALGLLYAVTAVGLRLLVWCAQLLRDRWFMHRINGTKISAASLLARFSFSDMLRAVVLALTLRFRCFCRGAAFFALPALCLALSFMVLSSGVSSAVLAVVLCADILLVSVAALFYAAAACSVRYCVKLCCLEKSGLISSVEKKVRVLDSSCFRLLRLHVMSGGLFSSEKIMAGMIFSENAIC